MRSGLFAVAAMLEADREELCGARYAHTTHGAHRAGHVSSELAMGGRRVGMERPRVRSTDGRELHLPTWEQFAGMDPLAERAYEQMVVGVATRKYGRSLEPLGAGVKTRGTSKSAVSRRFVAATEARIGVEMERPIELRLAALMIDGIHFGEHVVLIALGIDEHGQSTCSGCAKARPRTPHRALRCSRISSSAGSIHRARCSSSSTAGKRCARRSARSSVSGHWSSDARCTRSGMSSTNCRSEDARA